ncbi:MAG: XRE family transcriptional regulator [Coriobacteriia bacterium]|nr:XRE family transcriptional regulator [Coriobacteriia bacterium]
MSNKKEILTEELLEELLSKPKIDCFADNEILHHMSLNEYLNTLLKEKSLEKKDVIHNTNLNETHAYQIFSGDRNASRDKILQIAFAMKLSLKECNRLLHCAGVSSLYCKNRRDAIIIYCLDSGRSVDDTNDELYRFDEDTL